MIENDKELEITRTKLKEFEETLAQLQKLPVPEEPNAKLDFELDIDALTSYIEKFRQEIAEYLGHTAL